MGWMTKTAKTSWAIDIECRGRIYHVTDKNATEVKRQVGFDASNPASNITWLDAAWICKRIVEHELMGADSITRESIKRNLVVREMDWISDYMEILDIDEDSFLDGVGFHGFKKIVTDPSQFVLVASVKGVVLGWVHCVKSSDGFISLQNIAVKPENRRMRIGSALLDALRVGSSQFPWIVSTVRERNLPAQLFFRENGFECKSILRNYYEGSTEDAYFFRLEREVKHAV